MFWSSIWINAQSAGHKLKLRSVRKCDERIICKISRFNQVWKFNPISSFEKVALVVVSRRQSSCLSTSSNKNSSVCICPDDCSQSGLRKVWRNWAVLRWRRSQVDNIKVLKNCRCVLAKSDNNALVWTFINIILWQRNLSFCGKQRNKLKRKVYEFIIVVCVANFLCLWIWKKLTLKNRTNI